MKKTFIRKGIFACIAAIVGIASSFAQTAITTGAINPASVCVGASVTVAYTATGTVTAGTIFSAELSDETGVFPATPNVIGTGTTSPLNGVIPVASTAGSAYKIRVTTSIPAVVGDPSSAFTVNAIPGAPVVASPVNYSVGDAATALPSAAGYLWYNAASGGTGSATAPTPSTATAGTKSYFVSQKVGDCEGPRSEIVVNVVCVAPATPVVVSPVSYIQNAAPAALSATALSGATLNWYGTSATGGTASATAPVPSTSAVGTTTYYVSQSVGTCESPRSAIVVNVAAAPCTTPAAPVVTTPVNVTVGQTATLTATAISGATLNWYGTSISGGTASATAPTVSTATVGSTTYYVSQSVGTCESPRSAIVVNVAAAPCTTPAAPVVTTPVNVTVGQTATLTAIAISGATLNWYGTNITGGTASATAPTVSTATVGSTTYYVSQSVGTCESPRSAIVVNVAAAPCTTPAAPVVTTPVNVTVGQTATLTAIAISGATLNWYGTNITGGTASATAPTVSTATVGSTTYYVSQTVGTCESPRSAIVVNVAAAPCTTPAAPVVTTPVNVTVGQTATLTATAISGATLNWYGTSISGGTASATAPTVSTATVGSITYYVSQSVGTCESPRSAIVVNVAAAPCTTPAAPVVTTPVNVTVGQTATLTATAISGAALNWYGTAATGGTASATAPVPSTAAIETTTYYVSQSVGSCESPRSAIVVNVAAAPCTTPAAPVVITPLNYTVGQTATLTATAISGAALNWYGTAATGGTASATAPVPSTAAIGTTTYYVSQSVGSCESVRSVIVVNVTAAPCNTPAPTVSSPVNYTIGATASALTATGTNLKWYAASSGGTAFASAPIPSTTVAGTLSFFVSQTLNNCEGPRAELKVVVAGCSTPAPTVSSPVNYTVGATASALTATGTNLKWYAASSGGTALASAPVPSTTVAGTISFFVSQTLNNCEGPRAEIVVSVASCATVAPTVSPVTYCFNASALPLTATGTALKWYSAASGGTALATAPTPSTAVSGITSYFVSQTLNNCEGPRAELKVTVTVETPKPTVSATLNYCFGETAPALTATGTLLKWYNATGAALAAAPTPDTKVAGTISYFVTQTLNNCESVKAEIKVTVNSVTPAPTVANPTITYCFNQSPVVLSAIGTGLKWYAAASGGTALGSAPTPTTTVAATTSYFVSQTLNGCESVRTEVKVIVNPQVAAPTIVGNTTIEYCQSVKAPALSATPISGATLNWYGTSATGGTSSSSAPTPSTDIEGTVTYYVGQTDANGCSSARASISVKTNVTPKPAVATPSVAYCQNATATALAASGTNLKWYLTIDDTNPRTTPLTPYTAKVEDYSFYVTQTGTNTCESAKAEIKVHIKPLPSATISGNSSIPLGGTANVLINFTGDAPWTYILSNGISSTTSSASLSVPVSPTVTTNYSVTEVSNACGKGIINGIAIVTVQIPTLTIGVPSVSESCAGKTFTVQFQQSGSFPDGSTMKVQISTVNETSKFISVPSVVSGNVITATIPDTTIKGVYYVRIANVGKDGTLIAAGNVSSGQITVNPLPVATLSGTTTIYMGATANLKVDLTGDAPWTFSLNNGLVDSLVSTSVNPIIVKVTPKTTTTYTITKVSNQCGSGRGAGGARIQVDPVLGTEPPVVSGDWLKIYPTLVDSKCTVEITSAVSAKEADVEILDLTGRSLFKKSIREKITEVDFSQRPAGLYLIKVQNGKYSSVQRILKP